MPLKNYRPFAPDGRSLVDITIERLVDAGFEHQQIWLSCEDQVQCDAVRDRHGIRTLLRSGDLCDNRVPLTNWLRSIVYQMWDELGDETEVAWAQVCDPFFAEHRQCVEAWGRVREMGFDSLPVCYPWRGYLLDHDKRPMGWGFGDYHLISQELPWRYTMPFTFSILTPEAIGRTSYHVGARPYWYVARGDQPRVDIDTPRDFRVAQLLWQEESAGDHGP